MTYVMGMKKYSRYLAVCIMLALGLGLSGCNGNETVNPGASSSVSLKAGAGAGEIVFPSALFATPSAIEGFGGVIHDNPHARVLVLETDIKVAIVSLELVRTDADGVALVKDIVNQYTGTPKENIWVHSNHTITTPHEPSDAALNSLWMGALQTAITEAAQQAAASFQPAKLGFATGTSDVNINRNVLMSDGQYHIGLGGTQPSNKTMTILGVNSLSSGQPIGFLISYGVKPTAIDNAGQSAGVRQISADVPGQACRMMEQQFGVPAMFMMGASGDQVPKYDAYRAKDDGNGTVTDNYDYYNDVGMDYIIAQMTSLGTQMGNDAIAIAKTVSYTSSKPSIARASSSFDWPDASTGASTSVPVQVIRVGNAAFVGFKPELDSITEQQLQAAALKLNFTHTMLAAFLDGDAKYMPHAEAFTAPLTVEAKKAGFAKGAAEQLVTTSLTLLDGFPK
jgi:neutral ceramidase